MSDTISMDVFRGLTRKVEEQRKALAYLNSLGGNNGVKKIIRERDEYEAQFSHEYRKSFKRYLECKMYRQMLNDAARDYTHMVATLGAYIVNSESKKTCKNVSDPSEGFLCSECGWGDFDEPTHLLKDAKFCPNCGRRIEES